MPVFPVSLWFYFGLGAYVFFFLSWRRLRKRGPEPFVPGEWGSSGPLPLDLGARDYLRAAISVLFLFMRVFSLRPGLYSVKPAESTVLPSTPTRRISSAVPTKR